MILEDENNIYLKFHLLQIREVLLYKNFVVTLQLKFKA